MKKLLLLMLSVTALASCSPNTDQGRIYFFGQPAATVNLFSVDLDGDLVQHTQAVGGREIDMRLDVQGNMVFTSNRVLPGDRAQRLNRRKGQSRRQDFNVFYQPRVETPDAASAPVPFGKTDIPETQAGISPDGRWLSFIRTVLKDDENPKNFDELYIMEGIDGEPLKIATADTIIKPDWSPDSSRLVFAHYNYEPGQAALTVYDVASGQSTVLLENPWEKAQIDAPQWSPDASRIALVQHPLTRGEFRKLHVLDPATKRINPLSGNGQHVQSPVSWSSNNRDIVYGALIDNTPAGAAAVSRTMTAHIFMVDAKDGKTRQVTSGENQRHTRPVFSPNNKLIAYLYSPELSSRTMHLRVIDRKGNTVVESLYDKASAAGYLIWQ